MISSEYDTERLDMGEDALQAAIDNASRYDAYETLASYYGIKEMTPRQLAAWAAFAVTLGNVVIGQNGEIQRPKSHDEIAETILQRHRYDMSRREKSEQ